ncbi:MAG TPA: carboxypeptidase regulatory-like domain-containing protein [Candidatus Saccharimonadales bacterium]|nr:carboxypeptidase regulatory-like domain-containing protein [Candidatus Saccharimonadales bacterium]
MIRYFRHLNALAFVCLTALTILWGGAAGAQTFRGTILGTVTDSSGAAIAGAAVQVKNIDTGLVRTVTTSEDGTYAAPELPIGNYSVTVEKAGFRRGVVTGVRVEVSSELRADVALQTGELAQTVEVSGDTLPQVESTSNTLGGIIESRVVTNLPVNGRDYQKLIFLVPGVAGSPDQITDSPGSFGIFSVNGARGRANNFLLDGTDMNDGYRNDPAINEAGVFGTPATILPIEAIAELRVASNFEAEYGRSAGGVINVVTKSGTNQFHGSGFEFLRNNAVDARNFFNDAATQPQNSFHNNQFGGSIGGPIIKDKTFFFVDYEGMREKGAEASTACVPTAGDIATAITNAGGENEVIANLLARNPWPTPNLGGSCYDDGTGNQEVPFNITLATPFSNRVDSAIVKIDHSFNANNLLTGRYYIGDSDQSFPLALVGGGLVPGYNTVTPTRVQLISLSYVSTLSPSVLNEARFGWNRFAEGFFPEDRGFDPTSIGLNTVAPGTTNGDKYNFGLPKISVANFAPLGADNGDPRQRVDTNWHYIDNVSWKAGRHDIKFGYEFRRTSISQMFNRGFRGTLSFDTLDDFVGGTPDDGSQRQGNTNRNTFENSYSGYVQDSFHLRKNFIVNLGLRYDYYGLVQEKHGNFTNIDPTTGQTVAVGQGRLYEPDFNNFAPRVSVAWDVTGKGKTVVRAGYGFFYDALSQDLFMGHLPWNSVFDPGPAYSGAFGIAPNAISVAGITGGPLDSNQPVYSFFAPGIGDGFGVDQHLRTPYMQNFNLNFQQELTHHMSFQVGYVGSNGHKLYRFRDINQPSQAMITAADLGCDCSSDYGVPRVFQNTSNLFYINYEESSANSSYNSLQTSYRINDWHGVTSTLNYTWSHSIDDASDGEDFVPNASQPNDSASPIGLNRGNSNFDIRHRLTWNFIYEFPNHKGSWQKLTDGWGLNGIVTVQSGQPFQLNYNFEGDYDGSGEGFGRPDVVGPIKYNQNDPNNFLDLTAFSVPCTPSGDFQTGDDTLCTPGTRHFGNLGRNSLLGPHFRQFDFSIFKKTNLTEHMNLELRFEAYNLFNHPNFASPYLPTFIADAAPNGFTSTGQSAGALRLTATGDVGIGYPFLGSGGPRGLQIAAKITF